MSDLHRVCCIYLREGYILERGLCWRGVHFKKIEVYALSKRGVCLKGVPLREVVYMSTKSELTPLSIISWSVQSVRGLGVAVKRGSECKTRATEPIERRGQVRGVPSYIATYIKVLAVGSSGKGVHWLVKQSKIEPWMPAIFLQSMESSNLVPRVFWAFKMAGWIRPW